MIALTNLRLSLYLMMFLAEETWLRPVQEKRFRRNDWYKNATLHKNSRVRRSIPDMDAVNPAFFDADSQPNLEQPMDPRGDTSHFALTDQVGNLFRSNRLGKQAQKTHARPTQGERAVNLGVEEQSMINGRLPADEQEECYKQQNIESPSQEEPPRAQWEKDQEPQAMPIMEIAQEPQTWLASDGGQEVYEKQDKIKLGGREVEKQEIDSLYSEPEQVLKLKKVKSSSQPSPDLISECSRVYKPLGIEAEFPVYDEDIDFHPDPLQGILDDKYWLDPQEQEAVIRKYIDLAANNMMTAGIANGKRDAVKGEHEVKSVNSKLGFKDVDSKCPCKEISACNDCSKGKKKTNNTESGGEDILYGRKLLSLGYNMDKPDNRGTDSSSSDGVSNLIREKHSDYNQMYMSDYHDSKDVLSVDDENTLIHENVDGLYSSFNSRKLLSLNKNINIDASEIKSETNEYSPKKHNVIGRHILWYSVYDDDEESYNDEADEEEENLHSGLNKVSSDRQIVNGKVVDWLEDKHSNTLSQYSRPEMYLDKDINDKSRAQFDLNNITSNQLNQSSKDISLLKTPNKPPGYYSSNKLANMMQHPFQEKPKGPKKNKTDPSHEFEVMRQQTLDNATFVATSEKPPRPKICLKRGNINHLSAPKNRRSYSDQPTVDKNQQVASLFQSEEGFMGSGMKDGHQVSSSSKQSDISTSQSQAINCTTAGSNLTTVSTNKTSQHISNHSNQNLKGKFDDRDAQETVDAEVANDIVETVISESEKSSVLGHNLGIFKRNESVTKMKYGKIVPEAEKVLKLVTDCIMDRIKAHLALESCILLDDELLEFLKWLVLSGESYKEYMQRLGPSYYDFVPVTQAPNATTCGPPTSQTCEPEPLPPNPNIVASLGSNSAKAYR